MSVITLIDEVPVQEYELQTSFLCEIFELELKITDIWERWEEPHGPAGISAAPLSNQCLSPTDDVRKEKAFYSEPSSSTHTGTWVKML